MKFYTYQQVRDASIDYFGGDELAAEVFVGKYALQDLEGNYCEQTPADMHVRLAREFARIESNYPNPLTENEIFALLSDVEHVDPEQRVTMLLEELAKQSRGFGSVVAQGSPMSAIGNPFQFQSLSNCFVIESPHDSYGGIMKTDQEQAQIMKRRGGVGFDISTIRPMGIKTANAARTSDGIASFMERFSNTCREVAQGGRRGALILTISVHYPEIRTFINIKKDKKKVTGANVSIRLSDEFMNAVKDGTRVQLRYPVEPDVPHTIEEWVDARELWHEIIQAAWESAEPGLLFWDTIIRRGPADAYADFGFKSTSTNPCGELILAPSDACRLLLINLTKFVTHAFTPQALFDFKKFQTTVMNAQKLMDDLVDLEIEAIDRIIKKIDSDPEPENVKCIELELWKKIREKAVAARRTGLGITGLGDTLAYLGIRYGSDQSITIVEALYRMLSVAAYRSTVEMARDRGPFPIYSHDVESNHEFIRQVMAEDPLLREEYEKFGRRNIALTTTAPAGSVSIMTQTTSGCEPVFMLNYKRRKKINPSDKDARVDFIDAMGDRWHEYTVYHHGFRRWMNVTGKTDPVESPYANATSSDIDWVKKIDVQAAAQKWVCHSISNTTNIPSDASIDVVKQIYMRGWESGCKGVTIYRDGSRDGVLIKGVVQPKEIGQYHAPKRPKELECDIHRVSVKGESYLIFVGLLGGLPYEIFAGLSEHVEVPKKAKKGMLIKNGVKGGVATYNLRIPIGDDDFILFKDVVNMFDNPIYGAFTRTISLAMRHGVPVQYLVEQLRKDKHSDITSFSAVIARTLSKNYIPDGTKASQEKTCAQCGSTNLSYQSGCVTCMNCGNSRCS